MALFGVVWLPLNVLVAAASGRDFRHHWVAALPVFAFPSVVLARVIEASLSETARPANIRVSRRVIAALAAAVIPLSVLQTARTLSGGLPEARMEQVGPTTGYVRAHTQLGDRIFVLGHAADVYFFSQCRPASRFIYPLPLLTARYADSALVNGLLDELHAHEPVLIIDATTVRGFDADAEVVPSLARWDPS